MLKVIVYQILGETPMALLVSAKHREKKQKTKYNPILCMGEWRNNNQFFQMGSVNSVEKYQASKVP